MNTIAGTPKATLGNYTLRFGMIGVGVGMCSMFRDTGLKSHEYRSTDMSRIRQKKVAEADGNEVSRDDIVNGYEYGDKLVTLTGGDRKSFERLTDGTITLTAYIDTADIDRSYDERTAEVFPQKGNGDAYALLFTLLKNDPGRALIGKYVPSRGKSTRVVVLRYSDEHGILVAHTCTYVEKLNRSDIDTIRSLNEGLTADDEQVDLARTIIESLPDTFDLASVTDEYNAAVESAVIAKANGGEVETPMQNDAPQADLMEALRASAAAASKSTKSKAPARKRTPKKVAA